MVDDALTEDRGDLTGAEEILRLAIARREISAYNNVALMLEERGAHRDAQRLFAQGARAGDPLAQRNSRHHRSQYERQLNRARRKRLRDQRRPLTL